jgi:hypothetical protein
VRVIRRVQELCGSNGALEAANVHMVQVEKRKESVMNNGKRQSWFSYEGDALLTFLKTVEDSFVRMICGICLFIWKRIPELLWDFLIWLREKCFHAIRIVIRLSRVTAVITVWLMIVFAPVAFFPNVFTMAWMAVALIGSVWGFRRQIKKQTVVVTLMRENSNARI